MDSIFFVAYDDDGKGQGSAWPHLRWIGLRQMGHTIRCEYDDLKLYPLQP